MICLQRLEAEGQRLEFCFVCVSLKRLCCLLSVLGWTEDLHFYSDILVFLVLWKSFLGKSGLYTLLFLWPFKKEICTNTTFLAKGYI